MAAANATVRRMPQRTRSNFLTRTATDNAAQLDRRLSITPSVVEASHPLQSGASNNPYHIWADAPKATLYEHSPIRRVSQSLDDRSNSPLLKGRSSSSRPTAVRSYGSLTAHVSHTIESKDDNAAIIGPRPVGAMPRPVGGQGKLGTFSGVFVPTSLNVLSILMFLRFGFILGQSGFLGMMAMLVVSYLINLITTFSLSAIATNGTVRGGGAYYLISRSLGPEFGGSIGIVFYLGSLLNTSMNAVGLIDCMKQNFGNVSGNWARWLPEGYWWEYLWGTTVLIMCTAICLAGSGVFARCSNGLLALLLVATFSIPFSAALVQPFRTPKLGIDYTGPSAQTFKANMLPKFTRHAAGSQLHGRETFQDLFGILFPATGGIFAGASMSGDLKHPSKAIPKGTLSGLALTFAAYSIVILAMATSISRETFYGNVNIIQDVNISGTLILLGEFATAFFSALMGVIGSAKLLQALSRDNLLPGFTLFGQGTQSNDEPTFAILMTYVIAQVAMLCDINQLASFVTMTYLMTFLVTNLACFLLKISSAPNFRPSFHYFNGWTAGFGTLISGITMFFVDGGYATGCVGILVILFLIIHYFSPPKSWGDVSQSLIYHQVRKYLLRLRQEHVKFWRPQILLFVNSPRKQHKLIQFCNALKKGALFVLGHVIIANDFGTAVPEARRQQAAWTKYIDYSRVKAFVNIAISPGIEWGTRNIVLGAGLGGMRPNIVIMGFHNLDEYRKTQPTEDARAPPRGKVSGKKHIGDRPDEKESKKTHNKNVNASESLPTDTFRTEGFVSPMSYVLILEDMLLRLHTNVAVAKGFETLEFPQPKGENTKKYIDLWPIQMSAEIASEGGEEKQNVLTTNFDTYTLILQLGCILDTVPAWKKAYKLRVAVFVEYESEVEEERSRVEKLLENLRIKAEVLVFWLASGDIKAYQVIVNGDVTQVGSDSEREVDIVLTDEEWWQDLQKVRGRLDMASSNYESTDVQNLLNTATNWPSSSFRSNQQNTNPERFEGLRRLLQSPRRRASSGDLGSFGVRLGMRTHKLHDDIVHRHASYASASENSESSEEDYQSVFKDEIEGDASSGDNESAESQNDDENIRLDEDVDISDTEQPKQEGGPTSSEVRVSAGDPAAHQSRPANYLYDSFQAQDHSLGKNGRCSASASLIDPVRTPEHFRSCASSIKSQALSDTSMSRRSRPRAMRRTPAGRFCSLSLPQAELIADEGPGPSIMFTATLGSPSDHPRQSIYNRQSSSEYIPASGFPSQRSVPLNFNDLPCRAQHLILNELMQQQSAETAVLFTTLPSPVEGTHHSLDESVSYLRDLEILCEGLPPVLLVHSNSMTVTMNL